MPLTGEAKLTQRADRLEHLLDAGTEAADSGLTILLFNRKDEKEGCFISREQRRRSKCVQLTRNADFADSNASQGAGKSRKTTARISATSLSSDAMLHTH